VTRLEPRSPAAHYNEGVALEALGRQVEAKAKYEQAIQLDPSYARAHANLANLLYATRRLDEAVGEYRAALRLDATIVDLHCTYAADGRFELAIHHQRTALQLLERGSQRESIDAARARLALYERHQPFIVRD
jgi:tetratricopeptide (TPR) repeat protein